MWISIFSYMVRNDTAKKKKTNKKNQKFFYCSHYWHYTHKSLQSDSADLERIFANWYKLERWNTGWEFLCLILGADYYAVSYTCSCIFFLFSVTGIIIGCHETTLVLICVHWHKYWSETCQKMKFSSKFWNCRMEHNTWFCLFFWLEAISCVIFGHRYIVFMETFLFKQLLNLNRMASQSICQLTQVKN